MFRYWSNLIFSVVVLFCVSVLVCVNMYLYILHVQCAAVCLHRSACAFIWASFLRFYVVPHHTHNTHFTHTHTHTLELRHNSHTHTHTLPTSMCVPSLFFALTSCLVSLQSRKASDQTKSIESKTDSIGSGRAIPIKQVRDRIRTLMIWGKYTVIG